VESFTLRKEIRRFIRETMNQVADDLACGSCHSWDEYRHKTGIVEGLALVERRLLDLTENEPEETDF
jgi:hypothetical protein